MASGASPRRNGDEVTLTSKSGKPLARYFPEVVEMLGGVKAKQFLLDGELIIPVGDVLSFDALQLRLHPAESRVRKLAAETPAELMAFDLLELDGKSLERLPLTERKAKLKALLGKIEDDAEVQYSEHVVGSGEKVFAAMCEAGHEGVIAKLGSSTYQHDRTKTWLKVKCLKRQEFVIGGWRPSEKKRGFASLLLGTWEDGKLIYRGRVGTGFNADSHAAIQKALDAHARKTPAYETVPSDIRRRANWVEPTLVGEIAYTEITPDGVLRHPSFIGLREDKPAGDVHIEAPASRKPAKRGKSKAVTFTNEMGIAVAEKLGVRLTSPDRAVLPDETVTKAQIVAYYDAVAERMLPHIANRPLSLVRVPHGSRPFFQKHDSGGFPDVMKRVEIELKESEREDHFYVDDLAGIVGGVQMSTLEFHIWGSHIDNLEKPDRIIFDIDPDEDLDFKAVRRAALDIRDKLGGYGLESFAMVTGGKGIHVIAPLTPKLEWPDVKLFCHAFAERLAIDEPDRFTANIRKVQRKGRMFIDYLRNERGSTAIAPFSTRGRKGVPCAVPVGWDEVETLKAANAFSLGEAAERAKSPDPWKGYFDLTQSITVAMVSSIAGDKR